MLDSLDILAARRPWVHESARFNTEQLHAYSRGYYAALGRATLCIEMTARQFALFESLSRARRRAEKRERASA